MLNVTLIDTKRTTLGLGGPLFLLTSNSSSFLAKLKKIKQLILPVKSSHSQATSSRSNAVYMGFRPPKGNHAIYKEIKQFTRKVKQCTYISKIKQICRYNYFTVCEEMKSVMVNAIFCSTRLYEKKRKKIRAPTVM